MLTVPAAVVRLFGLVDLLIFYTIKDLEEAKAYLLNPTPGTRLIEISKALLELEDNHATRIFGSPDDLKLKSSMTLFAALPETDPVYTQVLIKYFNGIIDWETLRMINLSAESR